MKKCNKFFKKTLIAAKAENIIFPGKTNFGSYKQKIKLIFKITGCHDLVKVHSNKNETIIYKYNSNLYVKTAIF